MKKDKVDEKNVKHKQLTILYVQMRTIVYVQDGPLKQKNRSFTKNYLENNTIPMSRFLLTLALVVKFHIL